MSKNDRRLPNVRPTSAPPATAPIDATWDDETVPGLDLDDPLNEFDRVTAIPDLPSDQYVKQVMETAEDSRVPGPGAAPLSPITLAPNEYFTLDSEPPPLPRRRKDSMPPLAPGLASNLPTARPAAAMAALRSPGVPPQSPSLTGLELADLSLDNISPPEPGPVERAAQRDPRDPPLELSFEEFEGKLEPFRATPSSAHGDMKDRYAMGDFSGALVIAESILEADPDDLDAPRYAQNCRDVLTQMYSARLGSLDQIVAVAVDSDQIRWLTLDHRAGFLLSLIDGGSTVDQILDISGMKRLDALRIMYQLLDQRVISLGA